MNFKDIYADMIKDLVPDLAGSKLVQMIPFSPSTMTVTDWLNHIEISDSHKLRWLNARTAYDIRNSPLGKALA